MEEKTIPLHLLPTGSFGKVKELRLLGSMRRRLLDLGLINGTVVESLRRSPFGDPTAYQIRGAVIALRQEEASHIYVERI
jgi:ferrous iron transport protein A